MVVVFGVLGAMALNIGIEVRTRAPLWIPMKPNFKTNFKFSGIFSIVFGQVDTFIVYDLRQINGFT